MRIAYHAGLILLLASCENPSVLDGFDRPTPPPWLAINKSAEWLDPPEPSMDMHTWFTMDEASHIAVLEAWADAKSRYVRYDVLDTPTAFEAMSTVAYKIAKDPNADDRALEAALYLAQRMRRDSSTITSGATAAGIEVAVARSRAHPPPFAARFAPTDAEVFHVFAGEAEWMASHYPDQASAQWGWLATAPRDRKGFLAELERHPYADIYAEMARKMYTAVDAYQRWLAQ